MLSEIQFNSRLKCLLSWLPLGLSDIEADARILPVAVDSAPIKQVKYGLAPTNAALGTDIRFEMANGKTVRQVALDVDALRDAQGILKFNAKVPNSTVNLGVTKQQLDCAKVAGFPIDFNCLCLAERMSRRVPTVPRSKQPRNAAANSGDTVAARHDFRRVSAAARRLSSAQTLVKRTASALWFRPSRSLAVPSDFSAI